MMRRVSGEREEEVVTVVAVVVLDSSPCGGRVALEATEPGGGEKALKAELRKMS